MRGDVKTQSAAWGFLVLRHEASLKLLAPLGAAVVPHGFLVLRHEASLKLSPAERAHDRAGLFPRASARGLIEARTVEDAVITQSLKFPRASARGLIEAPRPSRRRRRASCFLVLRHEASLKRRP